MALKVVHYALIALAIALGLAVLYWRWRRVNNQNKALEAELRLIQPYNNMASLIHSAAPAKPAPESKEPEPEVVQMTPVEQPIMSSPPVLTPRPNMPVIEESDSDDDAAPMGAPPVVEQPVLSPISDPMFVDFVSVMSMMPPAVLNQTLAGNIVELPDDSKVDEPVVPVQNAEPPVESVELLEDAKPATRAPGARRRRNK